MTDKKLHENTQRRFWLIGLISHIRPGTFRDSLIRKHGVEVVERNRLDVCACEDCVVLGIMATTNDIKV